MCFFLIWWVIFSLSGYVSIIKDIKEDNDIQEKNKNINIRMATNGSEFVDGKYLTTKVIFVKKPEVIVNNFVRDV
jgi:hypothetical protein